MVFSRLLGTHTTRGALYLGLFAGTLLAAPSFSTAQTPRYVDGGAVQNAPNPERRARRQARMERLSQELNLNARQRQDLRGIFRERRQQIRSLRQSQQRSPARRQAIRSVRRASRAQVEAILTPAQRTQFAALRENRRTVRHQRRFDRTFGQLSLSTQQNQQVVNILNNARTRAQTIRRQRMAPEAQQAALRSMRQETRAQIRPILTPEQRQELRRLRSTQRSARQARSMR